MHTDVRSEVFTTARVMMMMLLFRVLAPCRRVVRFQSFEETYFKAEHADVGMYRRVYMAPKPGRAAPSNAYTLSVEENSRNVLLVRERRSEDDNMNLRIKLAQDMVQWWTPFSMKLRSPQTARNLWMS